jgi:hypothetical protein
VLRQNGIQQGIGSWFVGHIAIRLAAMGMDAWSRAAPMRLTLVDGIATFEDGKATGARPGTPISPTIASS